MDALWVSRDMGFCTNAVQRNRPTRQKKRISLPPLPKMTFAIIIELLVMQPANVLNLVIGQTQKTSQQHWPQQLAIPKVSFFSVMKFPDVNF